MNDFKKCYNELIERGFFTENELALVTDINGDSIETLEDCIYARFGENDIYDFLGIEKEEE